MTWRPPALRQPIRAARVSRFDRIPPLLLLAGACVLSFAGHLLVYRATQAGGTRREAPVQVTVPIRLAIVARPPPAPEAPVAPPPKVVPVHRRLANAPPPPPQAVASPAPAPEPPAPSPEIPLGTASPVLLPGVALSATTGTAGLGVHAGQGQPGSPSGTGPPGGDSHPYRAKEFAPAYALTEEPVFLDNVSPEKVRSFYPEEARKAKIEAVVRAQLTIDDDGSVVKVGVLGDPGRGFGAAATKVARLYRFKPARVDGRPVATEIVFTIRFELE